MEEMKSSETWATFIGTARTWRPYSEDATLHNYDGKNRKSDMFITLFTKYIPC
jgi:hypothetical protein